MNHKGQPVLVGTTSVDESEVLSRMLRSAKIQHNVLNAKQHQKEAEIVARAGFKNSITISTNMAGRGTDIKLGEEVKELGGLFILGTGRHESRRIDLQLRGRSGRQGDLGASVFYLSLEDNLMRLFGSDRIAKVMDTLGLKEGEVITHSMITKSIERAQKKIEAMNFGSRKNIIEYDDVMNYQRDIVYTRRNYSLHEEDVSIELKQIISEYLDDILDEYCGDKNSENWDFHGLNSDILNTFSLDFKFDYSIENYDKIKDIIIKETDKIIEFKKTNYNEEFFDQFQRFVILRVIDKEWQDHLYMMDQLREGINLRAYGQKNPLIEYKHEGFAMFEEMMKNTNRETLKRIFRTDLSNVVNQSLQNSVQPSNIQTQKNQNILSGLNQPSQSSTQDKKPDYLTRGPSPIAPNQKRQPIKTDKKIGRNDKVTLQKGSESITIKYKKVQKYINEGWTLSE